MWSLLRNVSTVEAFQQAGAWQSTYEAAQSLARRLQWYRDGLADKWSPDSSEAAALYLGRLDELIGSAQQLADVSVANRQALVTLANAVDEARPKLQRVYEESQALRQIESQPKAVASVASRQQQLHKQATEIMESLGDAAMDSWRHYATADDYQPPQPVAKRSEDQTIPAERSEPAAGRAIAEPDTTTPRFDEVRTVEDSRAQDVKPVRGSGQGEFESPGLTGVVSKLSVPTVRQAISATVRTQQGADSTESWRLIEQDPLRARTSTTPPIEPTGPIGQLTGADESRSTFKSRKALATGGVIGDTTEGPISGRGSARAVNTVGGVIGHEENQMGTTGTGPNMIGRGGRELRRRREYDPEERWPLVDGVSPVLQPGQEPTNFDPGTGVIGLDR
jgi:hypothetical protein